MRHRLFASILLFTFLLGLVSCMKRVEPSDFYIGQVQPLQLLETRAPACIKMYDGTKGIASNYYQAFKTNNGGLSWTLTHDIVGGYVGEPEYPQADTAYFMDDNDLYRSIDGGATWNLAFTFYTGANISFYKGNCGYAYSKLVSSSPYYLLKTVNAGGSWFVVNYSPPSCYNIHFLNENVGFAESTSGYLRTTDGGLTWVNLDNAITSTFTTGHMSPNGILFRSMNSGLVKLTRDFGTTWTTVFQGDFNIFCVTFTENGICFLATEGVLLMTKNWGATWHTVLRDSGEDFGNHRFYYLLLKDDKTVLAAGHEFISYDDFFYKITIE
ncbi:MAG TPA: hypothetical protein VI731_09290 [Bacteroidia bacterium]|nr:hypothetical protein [Bacteroidia bacterium]